MDQSYLFVADPFFYIILVLTEVFLPVPPKLTSYNVKKNCQKLISRQNWNFALKCREEDLLYLPYMQTYLMSSPAQALILRCSLLLPGL